MYGQVGRWLEGLLDKLCDTASITGKGKEKTTVKQTGLRNPVLHYYKLFGTYNTKKGLGKKREGSF